MSQWQAFAITLACEIPVMLLLAHRHHSLLRVALVTTCINALTHPIAWHIALLLNPAQYRNGVWVIESAVVLVEAAWYCKWLGLRPYTALGIALAANAASLGIGWWLW